MNRVGIALVGIVIALALGYALSRPKDGTTGASTDACPAEAACDEAAAVTAAKAQMITQRPITASVARLLPLSEAYRWAGLQDASGLPGHGDTPVWLVGLLADGLRGPDYGLSLVADESTAVPGMWFILNASTRSQAASGGLDDEGTAPAADAVGGWHPGSMTFSSIVAMKSSPLDIRAPTPFPTITPGPSRTPDHVDPTPEPTSNWPPPAQVPTSSLPSDLTPVTPQYTDAPLPRMKPNFPPGATYETPTPLVDVTLPAIPPTGLP